MSLGQNHPWVLMVCIEIAPKDMSLSGNFGFLVASDILLGTTQTLSNTLGNSK